MNSRQETRINMTELQRLSLAEADMDALAAEMDIISKEMKSFRRELSGLTKIGTGIIVALIVNVLTFVITSAIK